jgi:hypothetical protein
MRDDEPLRGDAAESADERLEGGLRVARRRLTPELVDDGVDADGAADLARRHGERGDEGLGEGAGRLDERSRAALDDDRAEHAYARRAGTGGVHAHEPTRGHASHGSIRLRSLHARPTHTSNMG